MVTASGVRLVIRGEADESIGLDQEAWFLARGRQAGVPVPEVLWLGVVDTAAGPRTVMVQTAVAGRALSGALPGMSAGQRWSAARSCGQVIARLHSVQLGGFYLRHADGSFDFADVAALQAADLANRLDNLRLLAGAGLATSAADTFMYADAAAQARISARSARAGWPARARPSASSVSTIISRSGSSASMTLAASWRRTARM